MFDRCVFAVRNNNHNVEAPFFFRKMIFYILIRCFDDLFLLTKTYQQGWIGEVGRNACFYLYKNQPALIFCDDVDLRSFKCVLPAKNPVTLIKQCIACNALADVAEFFCINHCEKSTPSSRSRLMLLRFQESMDSYLEYDRQGNRKRQESCIPSRHRV